MILAQSVFQIFCSQSSIGLQYKSRKRGITVQWQVWWKKESTGPLMQWQVWNERKKKKKKKRIRLFSMLIPYIKFQDPISNRSWPYAKRNGADRQSYRRTGPNQYAPLNFFEVGGITMSILAAYFEHKVPFFQDKCYWRFLFRFCQHKVSWKTDCQLNSRKLCIKEGLHPNEGPLNDIS